MNEARDRHTATVETDTLETLIAASLSNDTDPASTLSDDEDLAALMRALTNKFGSSIKAVLLYGSYTRGERDSLVDLYVLLDGYPAVVPRWQAFANKILPPNVYQLEGDTGVRCKYALMPLRQFVRRLERDFHSYFWARFAQPTRVLFVSDAVTESTLTAGLAAGARRFLAEASLAVAPPVTPEKLFSEGIALTYDCELRAESGFRSSELVTANKDYFDALGAAWLREVQDPVPSARFGELRWPLRRLLGKLLSVARLIKAGATFNDGFDYLLWKIERHSGIYIEPTPAQRKLPLLLGWPVFWRLYRLGAFK